MTTTNHHNPILSEIASQVRMATVRHLPVHLETTDAISQQMTYEQRLLALFLDEVRRTGQYDYPALVEVAEFAYEVDTAPFRAVLRPSTIQFLCENLSRANVDIQNAVLSLAGNLINLAESLSSAEAPSHTLLADLEAELQANTHTLSRGIEYLVDLAQKYAQPTSHKLSDQEQTDAELIRKRVNDIRYIQKYLIEQAHAQTLFSELLGSDEPTLHFRRLYQYLDVLPGYCALLVNLTHRHIQDRTTGAFFATPAPY